MTKNPFKGMKLANRATAKLLRTDLNSDYKVTGQGLDAITNNLLTTQGSLGSALSGANARSLAAMQRITGRDAKKLNRIVGKGQDAVRTRYGSAIAGTPNLFGDAKVTASSQKGAMRALEGAGALTAKGSNEALQILQQAGQTAMDSGQYELAQALRSRSNDVEATIAQNRSDLAAQRADAEANEDYLRLQSKLANGGTGGAGFQSAAGILTELAQSGAAPEDLQKNADALAIQYNLGAAAKAKLQTIVNTFNDAGDADANVSSPAAQAFTEAEGISPSTALPTAQRNALNHATWEAYNPNKDVPDTAEALRIAHIERGSDDKGKSVWVVSGSNPPQVLDDLVVQAAIAYVQSTWMRAAAAAQGSGAVAPVAAPPTTSTPSGPGRPAPRTGDQTGPNPDPSGYRGAYSR